MEYEANEDLYNIQDRRVPSGDYLNPQSLLNGTYDEREASESFKQAISEWRNSKTTPVQQNNKKKVNFTNKTVSKDARIGTDQNTPQANRFKQLEDQIHSNHSLSYAERMLLINLRKNEVESRTSQVEVEEGLTSRTCETLIEEVPQSNNLRTSTVSLKHLPDPELIELNKSFNESPSSMKRSDSLIGKIAEKKKVPTRPPSSMAPTTPRPTSSRVSSALRKSTNKSSLSMINQESNICRVPSSTLKNISMRQSNLDALYKEENSVGEFLLLDVEKENSNSDTNTATKQDKKEAFKLSHKCKKNIVSKQFYTANLKVLFKKSMKCRRDLGTL